MLTEGAATAAAAIATVNIIVTILIIILKSRIYERIVGGSNKK